MSRSLCIVLTLPDDVAEFVTTAPPALAGALLAETLACSTVWRLGAWSGAGVAVAVGVLVQEDTAAALLSGRYTDQVNALRRVALAADWLFLLADVLGEGQADAPAVVLRGVRLAVVRAAEASREEWAGCRLPGPDTRYSLRVVLN